MLADTANKVVVVLVVVVHVAIVGVDVPGVVGVRSILGTRPIVVGLSIP
jgi:hypothetical protein